MKKQGMLLRSIELCVLMLCTVLFLGGCVTAEQKEAYKKIEAQSKTNAVNYIRDKYDIEAEVVEVKVEKVGGDAIPSNDPTGFATVTLKSDDKVFDVYITGEEKSEVGKDNYQKELICNQLAKEAEQICNFEAEDIYYEAVTVDCDMMINAYFNGRNIDEIKNEISGELDYKIVTLGADLYSYEVEDLREKLWICDEVYILNCDNEEYFELIKGMESRYFFEDVDDYALYVKNYIDIKRRKTEYVDMYRADYDGFVVCVENGTYCSAKEGVRDFTEWVGKRYDNDPKQAFGAYEIQTDGDRLYIYVENDKLDTTDKSYKDVVIAYINDRGEKREDSSVEDLVHNKYLTNSIVLERVKDIVFTVLSW